MVKAQLAIRLGQNPHPARRSAGRVKNIGIDGARNQIVPMEWAAMRSGSAVSRQSQIIDRIDTKGSYTISAPSPG